MILRRYMTQQVALNTVLILGFLVILLLGGRVIRYFGIAAEGKLDVSLLFSIIGYNLPYFLELILPLAFFIALMLVFGRLYVDHEMAVLNSSGISRGQLARMTIPLILALVIVEAALSLFGKPWGVREADAIWEQQAISSAFDLVKPQSFVSSGDYNLYVGGMSDDKTELRDVILVQTNKDKNKDVLILANKAVQVPGVTTQLDLFQGRRYEVSPTSRAYSQISFDQYRISIERPMTETAIDLPIETQPLSVVWQLATGQPVTLYNADSATKIGDGSSTDDSITMPADTQQLLPAQAELGYRFSMPWLIVIAPILAVPLAQVRPRQGRWLRLLPSIILYASCALILISLKEPVAKGRLPVSIFGVAIALFIALGLYLNWASRISSRIRFGRQSAQLATSNQARIGTEARKTDDVNNTAMNTADRRGNKEQDDKRTGGQS